MKFPAKSPETVTTCQSRLWTTTKRTGWSRQGLHPNKLGRPETTVTFWNWSWWTASAPQSKQPCSRIVLWSGAHLFRKTKFTLSLAVISSLPTRSTLQCQMTSQLYSKSTLRSRRLSTTTPFQLSTSISLRLRTSKTFHSINKWM